MRDGVVREEAERLLAARKPAAGEACELWPENVEPFRIFCALETQWRVASGFGVAYLGLIYSEAIAYMRELGLKPARRRELLEDLRAMERAVLPIRNRVEPEEDADV